MLYVDCFYYGFIINSKELIKFNISNSNSISNSISNSNSLIFNNNLVNYTTFKREQEKNIYDDEVKGILGCVSKFTLSKKQSYSSIEDGLVYLKL